MHDSEDLAHEIRRIDGCVAHVDQNVLCFQDFMIQQRKKTIVAPSHAGKAAQKLCGGFVALQQVLQASKSNLIGFGGDSLQCYCAWPSRFRTQLLSLRGGTSSRGGGSHTGGQAALGHGHRHHTQRYDCTTIRTTTACLLL